MSEAMTCDCETCRFQREEDVQIVPHVITVHHVGEQANVSCTCGFLHADWHERAGLVVALHRQDAFAGASAWQERWASA